MILLFKFTIKFFFVLLIILLFSHPLAAEDTDEMRKDINIFEEPETSGSIEIQKGLEIPKDMVYVPDGYFIIGSDDSLLEEEKSAHHVYLKGFLIDKYEVSNEEYEKFLHETKHSVPKYWYDDRFNDPSQPVVGVSWEDAAAYAKWANKRLPTEAEWEKAARGTIGFTWPWGNYRGKSYISHFLNIYGTADGFEYTSPVDHFILGVSPYKVFNMAGNVWEWCQDWFDPHYYKHSPEINPMGPKTGKYKVLRGGSWVNKIYNISNTKRIRNYPNVKLNIYGFRCAKSID